MREALVERLLRGVYSAVLYVLVPVTVYHLIWRGFRQVEYLYRWRERYASYPDEPHRATLWVHAVSVGEVNAAAPLVDALLESRPGMRLLVTTITPTGSARVASLWGERVEHCYLPYDLSGAVQRFLDHYQPRLGLIVETELWPNLLFCCRDHGVPVYIVNARLSARSLRGYRMLRPLVGRALRTVRGIAAQSAEDGRRFRRLGALEEQVTVTGNLKYDIEPDPAWAEFAADFHERAGQRPVWIAASTHVEEEGPVLAIHVRLRKRWPDLLLLWAPRHPERFRAVTQQAIEAGMRTATRTLTREPDAADAVFVIDTMGELTRFYACADVAFVGGSLQEVGGHNLLEPASTGTAMVTGPHLHNFADIARRLREVDALCVGRDADAVGAELEALLGDAERRRRMAGAALELVEEGRGAVERTLAVVRPDLASPVQERPGGS